MAEAKRKHQPMSHVTYYFKEDLTLFIMSWEDFNSRLLIKIVKY